MPSKLILYYLITKMAVLSIHPPIYSDGLGCCLSEAGDQIATQD